MPCTDITENIRVTLDHDNRIDSYTLSKKTCGGAIGVESLLLAHVGGRSIDDIVGNHELSFLQPSMSEDEIEAYLKLKHFHAIQSVLNVFVGISPGGTGDACTIAAIEYGDGYTVIDAEIKINLLADQIEPCDHCGPT